MRSISIRALSILILLVLIPAYGYAAPRASQGLINLVNWDFHRDGIVSLDGEWEFYPDLFIPPESFSTESQSQTPGLVDVPGVWNTFPDATGAPMGGYGFATYRLRVQLPAETEEVALYIPYVHTSYRLWVDGELLATNGIVGRTRNASRPQFRPHVAVIHPDASSFDIILHVSNFEFRNGGLPRSLELGTIDQVTMKQRRLEVIGASLFGAAIIMAFFFACIYTMHRENLADAFFSLFLLSIAARMLVTGNHLLARVTPDLSWQTALKIEYLTSYLSPTLFLLYLQAIFPDDVSKRVVKIWMLIAAVGTGVTLTLPGRITSQVIPVYMFIVTAIMLYFVYVGLKAAARNRPDSRLFVGGMVVTIVSALITFLRYAEIVKVADLIPFGIIALVVTQGLILAKRWVRAYHQTVSLAAENAQMLQKTEWQLDKLKEYRRLMTLREENLRRRIADMLHGRTQGRLFAATRRIEQAQLALKENAAKANQLLTDAKMILNQVREEDIRSTGKQLHPTAVGAGLVAAVETLLDTFEESYRVRFNVDPEVEAMDQSTEGIAYNLRLGIYRIVEEGLNNISKHAKAKSIEVSLTIQREATRTILNLIVADDGIGFEGDRPPEGLGIPTIDARVGDLDGTWTFTGTPGKGTTLEVLIPLDSDASKDTTG